MAYLTVLGDSIAAGYGTVPQYGFVPRLAKITARQNGKRIIYWNFGVPGMTSGQLASALAFNDAWLAGVQQASTVCVLIGGDDIIAAVPSLITGDPSSVKELAKKSSRDYMRLATEIRRASRASVVMGTIYNPYPFTTLASEVIALYNQLVIEPAAQALHIPIAPIHAAFEGNQSELIHGYSTGIVGQSGTLGIAYPVHPNAKGHLVIAETFAPFVSG